MALCACAAPAQIAVEIPLMAPQVVRPAPAPHQHPCEADQVRLGCRSADCLVAKQEANTDFVEGEKGVKAEKHIL